MQYILSQEEYDSLTKKAIVGVETTDRYYKLSHLIYLVVSNASNHKQLTLHMNDLINVLSRAEQDGTIDITLDGLTIYYKTDSI